jgi:1-acyl-sn-glycerol-3-phosphate acyltransferase
VDAPAYGLMHKAAFALPLFGRFLAKFGAIPANHANGDLVLREGFPLLVCPGGDVDALKPFRMRHRVVFDGRRGFIRMAIRNQVPVVPVVSVGAHEIFIILNEGRRTARWSGLQRYFRVKRVPMALSFPFGLTIAGVPSIPLPSKIRLRVLPPIELDERPEAADDAAVVDRCYEFIRVTMQRALDDLSAGRRFLLG